VTAHTISKYMKSQKITTYVDTVRNYLKYFKSCYSAHQISRFDIKGKKIFEINDKYYINDVGMCHSNLKYRAGKISQILENVVYMELLYRGYNVSVGASNGTEIDFNATKHNEKTYFQVTYLLASEETVKREFAPLLAIKDDSPEYVLSMDNTIRGNDYQGIRRLSIIDFLTY